VLERLGRSAAIVPHACWAAELHQQGGELAIVLDQQSLDHHSPGSPNLLVLVVLLVLLPHLLRLRRQVARCSG